MKKLLNKFEWCGEDSCDKCSYVDFNPKEDIMNYCTLYQINVQQKGKDWYFVKEIKYGENNHFQKLVDKITEDLK